MLSEQQVIKALKAKGISTDTRAIKPGELFIPIKGPKFDGRKFIPQALKKGALVLDVKDGQKALQKIAAFYRNKFNIPFIGVTGSSGKTTTKDMIASILSQAKPTLKNEENYNNEIGVPLTLLNLKKKHKYAVIEMAMQGLGEIEELAKIVHPHIAVVTNIGEAHLKFLKTRKNIAKAKAEIFKYLGKKDWAVINADDEYFEHLKVRAAGRGVRVITFGILEKADVSPKELKGIKLPVAGEHNVYNALAAIAVAKILKIKKEHIKKGLAKFIPSSKRMQIINRKDGVKIINDTYNANPSSMRAMLKLLSGLKGRKIAVLGEMLELGSGAKSAHQKIIAYAKKNGIDRIYTFGKLWPGAFRSKKDIIKKIKKSLAKNDIILVKGSRGAKMEDVVEALY